MDRNDDALERRVEVIEELLWPKGPNGPSIFETLQQEIKNLSGKIEEYEARHVTREEYDDYRRRINAILETIGGHRDSGELTEGY